MFVIFREKLVHLRIRKLCLQISNTFTEIGLLSDENNEPFSGLFSSLLSLWDNQKSMNELEQQLTIISIIS